jgi:hypothetical protein
MLQAVQIRKEIFGRVSPVFDLKKKNSCVFTLGYSVEVETW